MYPRSVPAQFLYIPTRYDFQCPIQTVFKALNPYNRRMQAAEAEVERRRRAVELQLETQASAHRLQVWQDQCEK
jgi:hypothetical protein